MSEKLLSLVVPIYNDAPCLPLFFEKITPVRDAIRSRFGYETELLFVADPSTDGTEEAIMAAHRKDSSVKLITLSRRFGQQPAMLAGILNCRGSACIVFDVDLQDPPELMLQMMEKHVKEGYNVVYAVRTKRHGEPWTKRLVTSIGYRVMNKLSTVPIPKNVGDFRLIDRRVIEEIRQLRERHGFFRGLVPLVGFKQTGIPFERQARVAGKTKYNYYIGSIVNGMNALVCFSNGLLALSSLFAVLFFFLSVVLSLVVVYLKYVAQMPFASGIPSLMILVIFTSGLQFLFIGILGSYVGRIYDETKQRPLYIVDQKVGL